MSYTEFYENGYGVSVISSEFSYGLELAVLRGTEGNAEICYDTPITDDVCGHLNSETLAEIIKDVKSLPKPNNCIKCDELSFNTICNTCKGERMKDVCDECKMDKMDHTTCESCKEPMCENEDTVDMPEGWYHPDCHSDIYE